METLINKLKADLRGAKEEMINRRVYLRLSHETFLEAFILIANTQMTKRNNRGEFIIDDENKELINQLYYYLTGRLEFKGDLGKGVFLTGNVGTGKTLIINTIIQIIQELTNKRITVFHAKEVHSRVSKQDDEKYYHKRPLFVDDIGKEPNVVNSFGTKTSPIADLFAARYDLGAWTFATSNHTKPDLIKLYGESTVDRFREMFNVIPLTGDSRRK
jgi:DNA replication protein DnaC